LFLAPEGTPDVRQRPIEAASVVLEAAVGSRILVVAADGREYRAISTSHPAADPDAYRLSPDGRELSWRSADGAQRVLRLADGDERTVKSVAVVGNGFGPVRQPGTDATAEMTLSGASAVLAVHRPGGVYRWPLPVNALQGQPILAWTADGIWVAADSAPDSGRGGRRGVLLVDPATGGWQELAVTQDLNVEPISVATGLISGGATVPGAEPAAAWFRPGAIRVAIVDCLGLLFWLSVLSFGVVPLVLLILVVVIIGILCPDRRRPRRVVRSAKR
jgi:hypothetical protein